MITIATKCVFLYGRPTQIKKEAIVKLQSLYVNQINQFINILIKDKSYYLDILNNNKKAPSIRALEKSKRDHRIGSAYGQNAVDEAVVQLHNHLTRIKNRLYGRFVSEPWLPFVSSIALFHCAIEGGDALKTIQDLFKQQEDKYNEVRLKALADKKKEPKEPSSLIYYKELLSYLNKLTPQELEAYQDIVSFSFFEELGIRKVPFIEKSTLKLDSRLFILEPSQNIEADFVLSFKALGTHQRIEVPLKTSSNSKRRLNQYKMSSAASMKILKNGHLKLTISFEKEVIQKSNKKHLRGVDVGITDLLKDSEGISYGSFQKVIDIYNKRVLPEQALCSTWRNKLKEYKKELRHKKCLESRKPYLRKKIDNLHAMLMKNKSLGRALSAYYHMQNVCVSEAVNHYVAHIKDTDTLTILEDLDIKSFKRGKQNNRRDTLWCRGMLTKRLEEKLNWIGLSVAKVDPAYTSKMCSVCFNIHDGDRNHKDFTCSHCGHTMDSDHNAAINIKNRAFDNDFDKIISKYKYNTAQRHAAIKDYYLIKHEAYKLKTVL